MEKQTASKSFTEAEFEMQTAIVREKRGAVMSTDADMAVIDCSAISCLEALKA